ncbi:hypothetical protein [Spirochaeta lutea]|uniref:PilZ domain-containing protein n=1 Tax=Spirochaeta lutea TaxID=1480694 RepID=A0A098QUI7_9SPIO|nr:hypothetical protein [Spirochaeta lutea]KGE71339.1 hypothetical protein DC28_11035 [Spirochaeta lutea]
MPELATCTYDGQAGLVKQITTEEIQLEFETEPKISVGRIDTFTIQPQSSGNPDAFSLKGEVHWIRHKDSKTIVDISVMELSLTGHIALKKLIQSYQKH